MISMALLLELRTMSRLLLLLNLTNCYARCIRSDERKVPRYGVCPTVCLSVCPVLAAADARRDE